MIQEKIKIKLDPRGQYSQERPKILQRVHEVRNYYTQAQKLELRGKCQSSRTQIENLVKTLIFKIQIL